MTWPKLNKFGAVGGVVGGMVMGLVAWLFATKTLLGVINTSTTQGNLPIIAGGATGLVTGAVVSIVSSLIAPDNFDFIIARAIGGRFGKHTQSSSSKSHEGKVPSEKIRNALETIEGDGRDVETDAARVCILFIP